MRIRIEAPHSTNSRGRGKAVVLLALALAVLPACRDDRTTAASATDNEIRILLSEKIKNLNPRHSIDAIGQRVGAMLFRALTRIDENLEARPDLAADWKVSDGGRTWTFRIRPGLQDQGDEPISAARIAECLEQYRLGKPVSPHASAFPNWVSTHAAPAGEFVTLRFSRPDPYLARNLSLLRYFRVQGNPVACAEPPSPAAVIPSGSFRMEPMEFAPEGDVVLVDGRGRRVRLLFIRDDTTLALRLLRGDIHYSLNSLSLPKTDWLKKRHGGDFEVREREGVNVNYLLFNIKDPILGKREVRQAIAHALDRDAIVRHKLFGFGVRADSLLLPRLPESHPIALAHDPALAERLLDQAGYPRPKNGGPRLRLSFKTQPFRDVVEISLIYQAQLRRVGIDLRVEVVESSTLLNSVRKGRFQLSHSRWVGIADGSILYRTMHSKQPNNRAKFSDPQVDAWLDEAMGELDPARRTALLARVQETMMRELPYLPLWYWNNALIARRELTPSIQGAPISLSGALEPLIRWSLP